MSAKKALFWLLVWICPLQIIAQDGYRFEVDLIHITNDEVEVSLFCGPDLPDGLIYQMPKIVPGTYSIYDFGRFVKDLKAFDAEGNLLKTQKYGDNGWKIPKSSRLRRIQYRVMDTWDSWELSNKVFDPAGTGWDANESFAINWFGVVGFFRGYTDLPYQVDVLHPQGLFGASGMVPKAQSDTLDRFTAADYDELADSPVLYSIPDTTTIKIGNTEVLIAVSPPNSRTNSEDIADALKEVLPAISDYLGNELPVERYAFLFHMDDSFLGGALGALEHNQSSFYVMYDTNPLLLTPLIIDFAAHEFFHIVTPLTLHSELIHDFNFAEPEISAHLWLYEGVTEYFAQHVQIAGGLTDSVAFIQNIMQIYQNSQAYNDILPFTELSLGCLGEHKNEYGNVYQKGALIGMCLDLTLLNGSEGKYDLYDLIRQLSERYGKERPFPDDSLLTIIPAESPVPLNGFFEKYVSGESKLPLQEVLGYAGIDFQPASAFQGSRVPANIFRVNISNQLEVVDYPEVSETIKKLNLLPGDIVEGINDQPLNITNYESVLDALSRQSSAGETVEIDILRIAKKKAVYMTVTGTPEITAIEIAPSIKFTPEPTEAQLRIRHAWFHQP